MATNASPLMMMMVEGSAHGEFRIKKSGDIIPTTVVKNVSDFLFPLVSGNIYWVELFLRQLGPATGNASRANLIYSGSLSYGNCLSINRVTSRSETSTTFDTAAVVNYIDDATTIPTGTTIMPTSVAGADPSVFSTSQHHGLLAPSSDGILSVQIGLNANTQGHRAQAYSIMRVERIA